jgi:hypothetical protein
MTRTEGHSNIQSFHWVKVGKQVKVGRSRQVGEVVECFPVVVEGVSTLVYKVRFASGVLKHFHESEVKETGQIGLPIKNSL